MLHRKSHSYSISRANLRVGFCCSLQKTFFCWNMEARGPARSTVHGPRVRLPLAPLIPSRTLCRCAKNTHPPLLTMGCKPEPSHLQARALSDDLINLVFLKTQAQLNNVYPYLVLPLNRIRSHLLRALPQSRDPLK